MPPLPWTVLQSKAPLSGVVELHQASGQQVILSWKSDNTQYAESYYSGVEKSVDLKSWETVARVPYASESSVVLTNYDSPVFFRVYNGIKAP